MSTPRRPVAGAMVGVMGGGSDAWWDRSPARAGTGLARAAEWRQEVRPPGRRLPSSRDRRRHRNRARPHPRWRGPDGRSAAARRDRSPRSAATIDAAGSPHVCLATVLVGDDGPSQRYVRSKHVQAGKAGIASRNETLPAERHPGRGRGARRRARRRPDGPRDPRAELRCPTASTTTRCCATCPADKDVDGLTEASLGRLVRSRPGLVGCTPVGRDAAARAVRRRHVRQPERS